MLIASLPPAMPPARVVAGVHISWPLSKPETFAAPATAFTVRISSKRRRATVSFVRVTAQGRTMRRISSKTLRKGSFTFAVPSGANARYALRLTVAGHKRWSWVTVPRAATDAVIISPPTPVAVPIDSGSPAPVPVPFCPSPELPLSAFRSELQLGATTVRAGEALPYTLANVGEGALRTTAGVVLHRETEGPPALGGAVQAELPPGGSLPRSLLIPADTPPGRYRVSETVQIAQCDYIFPTAVTSPGFDVTA